jgi:hypothetical protein
MLPCNAGGDYLTNGPNGPLKGQEAKLIPFEQLSRAPFSLPFLSTATLDTKCKDQHTNMQLISAQCFIHCTTNFH